LKNLSEHLFIWVSISFRTSFNQDTYTYSLGGLHDLEEPDWGTIRSEKQSSEFGECLEVNSICGFIRLNFPAPFLVSYTTFYFLSYQVRFAHICTVNFESYSMGRKIATWLHFYKTDKAVLRSLINYCVDALCRPDIFSSALSNPHWKLALRSKMYQWILDECCASRCTLFIGWLMCSLSEVHLSPFIHSCVVMSPTFHKVLACL
jgi:hypothetical protein